MNARLVLTLAWSAIGLAGGIFLVSSEADEVRAGGRLVVVPRVTDGDGVFRGYEVLRGRGLKMTIPARFSVTSLCMPVAETQNPRAGARVHRGASVKVSGPRCTRGSPAMPVPPPPSVVVPDMTGATLTAASKWAERASLLWQAVDLPPLRPSGRRRLLDNYVVAAQGPAAGSVAAPGTLLELRGERRPSAWAMTSLMPYRDLG